MHLALFVPQVYLIHYDDVFLPCNIPTQIVKSLTVMKHLVSSPLDYKDTSYYTAFSKHSYSHIELLFISPKTISFMVKYENNTENKSPNVERHRSPSISSQTMSDKMSVLLNLRTLRDIT